MVPTLHINQRVLVDRIGTHFSTSARRRHHRVPPAEELRRRVCEPAARVRTRRARTASRACDVQERTPSSETFIKRVVGLPRRPDLDPRRPRDPQRGPEKDTYIVPCGERRSVQLSAHDHDSEGRLLHDGRQPAQLRGQPLLGPGAKVVDHRQGVLHLLATRPDRLPLMASSRHRERRSRPSSRVIELVVTVAVAVGLALLIQAFIVKPYRIPSPSMVPTLKIGQRVLTNRLISHPSVGDIVVFHPPKGADPPTPVCGNPTQGGGHPAGVRHADPGRVEPDVHQAGRRRARGPDLDRQRPRDPQRRAGEGLATSRRATATAPAISGKRSWFRPAITS